MEGEIKASRSELDKAKAELEETKNLLEKSKEDLQKLSQQEELAEGYDRRVREATEELQDLEDNKVRLEVFVHCVVRICNVHMS